MFLFLFIRRELTTSLANNCLQIISFSCALPPDSDFEVILMQIIFCFCVAVYKSKKVHPRPKWPRWFWSPPGIETSGHLQNRKSAIHGLVVKSDKSDFPKKYIISNFNPISIGGVNFTSIRVRKSAKRPIENARYGL